MCSVDGTVSCRAPASDLRMAGNIGHQVAVPQGREGSRVHSGLVAVRSRALRGAVVGVELRVCEGPERNHAGVAAYRMRGIRMAMKKALDLHGQHSSGVRQQRRSGLFITATR